MKIIRNSVSNVVGFGVSAAVGIFYTPYLVKHLGVSSYGVVPLVMSLFVFANWLSLAVNWSVGRYFIIAYNRNEYRDASRIFNTSFFASLVLCLLIFAAAAGCAPFLGYLLRLPPGTEDAAKTLLYCGALATGFGIVSGVVEVGFFCLNRFDLRALMQVIRGLGTVFAVLLLFNFRGPKLEWIGVGSCFVAGIATIATYYWNRRLIPLLEIKLEDFSIEWFRKMLGTNVWILVDQMGTILMLNTNLLLANRLFGPVVSAEFALASQWETLLKSVMTALTVFTPTYIILVSKHDMIGLRDVSLKASRYVAILIAIGGGLVIGFSDPLVRIWLHREEPMIALLIIGLVAPIVINATSNPLYGVWQALNKVRIPSFATIIAGGIGILLSVILANYTRLGPWSVILGSACAFTLRNMVFSVFYVGKLISEPGIGYLKIMARSTFGALSVALTGLWISAEIRPDSWSVLAACLIMAMLVTLPLFWYLVLSIDDRRNIIKWLQEKRVVLFAKST